MTAYYLLKDGTVRCLRFTPQTRSLALCRLYRDGPKILDNEEAWNAIQQIEANRLPVEPPKRKTMWQFIVALACLPLCCWIERRFGP